MERSVRITSIGPSGDLSCSGDTSSLRVCAEHFLQSRCCAGNRQSLLVEVSSSCGSQTWKGPLRKRSAGDPVQSKEGLQPHCPMRGLRKAGVW